jgi:uncharacterized protein (DUF488 family)
MKLLWITHGSTTTACCYKTERYHISIACLSYFCMKIQMTLPPRQIFTIGHSTHPIAKFVGLLTAHGIEALVDVRAFPRSRFNPQFNKNALAEALRQAGIAYHHMVSLGGLRKHEDGPGETAFSAYVRFMKTDQFQISLNELKDITLKNSTAIMCAEALWWNCHRQFIAEAMAKDGFDVVHIMDEKHAKERDRSPGLPGL